MPTGPDADLVSFSLPFCPPSLFPVVWDRIAPPWGRLLGSCLATKTSGQRFPTIHTTRTEAEVLFQLFEIERFEEVEQDGQTVL